MFGKTKAISLKRRLVGQYLMFGLLGLLFCLATTIALSLHQKWDLLVPIAVCVPFLVLIVGATVVVQTVQLNSAVEFQLHEVSNHESIEPLTLSPLKGTHPIAVGWNAIVERLGSQDNWSRLEERLSKAVGNAQQEQVDTVFKMLPAAVAVTNRAGQIILHNQAFSVINDQNADTDLSSLDFFDIVKIKSADNYEEIAHRLNSFQGAANFDLRRGETLEEGVLRLSRTPMPLENEGRSHDVWILRDITQQLLAEDMRNQFVFTATHELRTPLGNIKSYAELLELEQDIDVEKQKEFYNIITNEASRLLRFVDELLNINQMEAGSMSIYRHQVDAEQLILNVVQHVKPEMEKKELSLSTKYPAKWPKLNLDKEKIESALVNLLGNAAKYTPEGGRISLEVEVAESGLNIQVEDSGIGIAEEELKRVFDKFFRSDDERVRSVSGNGLGLAFTQEVARLHGGRLEVSSELNKGSRFTFCLPLT